jgi:hypothetical protein
MIERTTDDESREQFLEMAIAWHTLAVQASEGNLWIRAYV